MKRITFNYLVVTISILFFYSNLNSQSIVLESQEDVDEFPIEYPDLLSVDFLSIEGEDVVDLSPLSQLEEVSQLFIGCPELEDLNGLQNVVSSLSVLRYSNHPN